jgi:hypothetical protein
MSCLRHIRPERFGLPVIGAVLATLALVSASAAQGQVAYGSARIESPVGGSFAIETSQLAPLVGGSFAGEISQKILSAIFVFRGSPEAVVAASDGPLAWAMSETGGSERYRARMVIFSRDAVSVGILRIKQDSFASTSAPGTGVSLEVAEAAAIPAELPVLLILAQFN